MLDLKRLAEGMTAAGFPPTGTWNACISFGDFDMSVWDDGEIQTDAGSLNVPLIVELDRQIKAMQAQPPASTPGDAGEREGGTR